jgi:hypothetical protein
MFILSHFEDIQYLMNSCKSKDKDLFGISSQIGIYNPEESK